MTNNCIHNTPMIAIEGTKGSGKSTMVKLLMENTNLLPSVPALYRPTAPAPNWLPVAANLLANPRLAALDEWQEKLYAERAAWHSAQLQSNAGWILADRCIATSYATRWQKWNSPKLTIERVDNLHRGIPIPHVIIWLDCKPKLALQRIAKRAVRSYGLHDQTPKRIMETYHAYADIMRNPPPRLANTQWYRIDAAIPPGATLQAIAACIDLYLIKQHHSHLAHLPITY